VSIAHNKFLSQVVVHDFAKTDLDFEWTSILG
jgi:hypothetical protein